MVVLLWLIFSSMLYFHTTFDGAVKVMYPFILVQPSLDLQVDLSFST